MKTGVELIFEERTRQQEIGFNKEYDLEYVEGELLAAAGVYISTACPLEINMSGIVWPWDDEHFKPGDPINSIRCLTKAGALIAAEIDRLQASQPKQ